MGSQLTTRFSLTKSNSTWVGLLALLLVYVLVHLHFNLVSLVLALFNRLAYVVQNDD